MHDIIIDGIRKHRAVKYSYLDDPHQTDFVGVDSYGRKIHKLGPKERLRREIDRGIRFIVSPYRDNYLRFLGGHLGSERAEKMLLWLPIGPDVSVFENRDRPLGARMPQILGNGATWDEHGFYDFRRWAFRQSYVYHIPHAMHTQATPRGDDFPKLLNRFAGAIAAFDGAAVPKYVEIPLAGCLCFAQWNRDYYDMGFRDFDNCIYIDRTNMEKRVRSFLEGPGPYQAIADSGRHLVEQKFTADHVAARFYEHARQIVQPAEK